MKSTVKTILNLLVIFFLTLAISCGEDDSEEPTPLTAAINISATQLGPGETVTVDATGSTGLDNGATFTWTISGSGEMDWSSDLVPDGSSHDFNGGPLEITASGTSSTISLTPANNGQFNVTLRLEVGNEFSEAGTSFQVEGSITLTEIPEDFVFTDVSPFSDEPDYVLSGDVTISRASINTGDIIVLALQQDATITITGSLSNAGQLTLQGNDGASWKGVLLTESGNISGGSTFINGAGSSGIGDYPAAALVVETSSLEISNITFEETTGYDLYLTNSVISIFQSGGITYSSQTPIYAPLSLWASLPPPFSLENDIITLEGGVDSQISLASSSSIVLYSDVLIKGGAFINSQLVIQQESNGTHTIYLEENTPLIASGGASFNNVNFDGENGSNWAGIYIGQNQASQIFGCTINNAGSAPIAGSGISGITEQTALYVAGTLNRFDRNTVSNSGGTGIYISSFGSLSNPQNMSGNSFADNAAAAVSVPQQYGAYFSQGNTFTTPTDVAAIEVRQTSTPPNQAHEWNGLGDGNFYHFTGFLSLSGTNITINEGAHFKFSDGKGIDFSAASFTANGTADDPIVFEGLNSGTASWYGMKVGNNTTTNLTMSHVTIDGGGVGMHVGASEEANLVIDSRGTINVTNCTFSNSDGYGVLIELDATIFDFEDANNANTFSGNTSGDLLDRNL